MLILAGGAVWQGAGRLLESATVVVDGARIVAVDAGTVAADAAEADVIDCRGRTVVPGFQDAHVHPIHGGLRRLRCDLTAADTAPACVRAVADYAARTPGDGWIVGSGWSMPAFPGGTPRKEVLDAVVADRPVYLVNTDGHGAWVNSNALTLAGITADTADPVDGRFERDVDGTPTGTLHEGAMALVTKHLPATGLSELRAALIDAQQHLHGVGITAWTDAWVEPDELAAYQSLADGGQLTARVTAALWWDRHRGVEQIDDLVAQRAATHGDRLTAGTVKIMVDGVVENRTAAMLAPYDNPSGASTGEVGLTYVPQDVLDEAVARLDRLGFQVHVHAIGDGAVRSALDAFAGARRRGGDRSRRHVIAHLQVIHPDDIARFATLGVVACAQPFWAQHEAQMRDLTIPVLGPRRSGWQYPWAHLRSAGAMLAFGSDWPVSTPDPLEGIDVAVHRASPRRRDADPFLPDERLSLEAALHAATAGSAFVHHLDDRTGTIDAGMTADLAVVDAPLFGPSAVPPANAGVALTMVGGQVVYRRAG